MKIRDFIRSFPKALRSIYSTYCICLDKSRYGAYGKNVVLQTPLIVVNPQNIYLGDNVNIFGFSELIVSANGKFVMKKNSGAAQGLTVVTGNHTYKPTVGVWHKEVIIDSSTDRETEVIVEEDVWLAANVTLLPGIIVGRGSIVGAGSVCRHSVPPYAIVIGNPAKVIGFKYTVEEILEHERSLYQEAERLPKELLEKNYQKYYQKRIKQIVEFVK